MATESEENLPKQNNNIQIKVENFEDTKDIKLFELIKNIKQEPIDDIANHIKVETCNEQDDESKSNETANETDSDKDLDKKAIEPVKSSNEILAELFKVFNATPPAELLNDKDLLKKSKKKNKKERKKKHKKSSLEETHTDDESIENSKELAHAKHKHKKKKKHKHKDDRDKEVIKTKYRQDKSKDSIRDTSNEKEIRIKEEPHDEKILANTKKRKANHYDDEALDQISKKNCTSERLTGSNSFYDSCKEYEKSKKISERENNRQSSGKINTSPLETRQKENGHMSEISLSDEETYLKERQQINGKRTETNHTRSRNSFYTGYTRGRSRERYHRRHYSSSKHNRSRSRSRSRSYDLGIDKKRLLEIARKNAISMFKRGNLPGVDNMSQEIKDKVVLKMRYGGRTVQDLTDFCKKISNGENLSDLSGEESDVDKNGNTKAFHHPFELKEREPIVMHIRNPNAMPPRKLEDTTKAITMQFPVSSGQQHRLTEAWIPVETKNKLAPLPVLPAATQSTNIFKSVQKNIFEVPVPKEEQEPAFLPIVVPSTTEEKTTTVTDVNNVSTVAEINNTIDVLNIPLPPATTVHATNSLTNLNPIQTQAPTPAINPNHIQQAFVPDVPIPSTNSYDSVFPTTNAEPLDVSAIITKRLSALRRLQNNPMDVEALNMMHNSQKEMSTWASSKHMPGQFTGSTGANILKAHELHSGPQIWARRDQLTSTQPVTGGMGMHLLQKMGWKPGEGLGREKTGSLQPLLLDVKLDKRGLVSSEDNGYRRPQANKKQKSQNIAQAQNNLQNKHPVCLLNEVTCKRKWTPPLYTLVNEFGPPHSKMFLYSVQVNGKIFQPDKASNTKKESKMLAARICLQELGLLPLDD